MSKVNLLPQNWELHPLGDIASFSQGVQIGTEYHISKFKEGYSRFIRIVDYTKPNNTDIRYVPEQGERYYANVNDIVMIRYGTPGVVGRGIEGVIANNMFKISFNTRVNNDYAEQYFKFPTTINNITNGSASSTMPAINFGFLKKLPFILPPLPEQQKIAEILSAVDDKIDIINQQITQTQQLKKGLMQRLLTKGIGHTEFKDSPLGEIPKSWEVVKLGEDAKIIMGQSPNGKSYNKKAIGIPVLNGPTEFTDTCPVPIQYTTEPTKKCIKGDILFCVRGSTTGRMNTADQEYCIGRGLAAIRGDNNSITEYINYVLQNLAKVVLRKAKDMGSTFPNVNSKELNGYLLGRPPIKEQIKIASILTSTDKKIKNLQNKNTLYLELKKGLMQQLLTGKIRVTGLINKTVKA